MIKTFLLNIALVIVFGCGHREQGLSDQVDEIGLDGVLFDEQKDQAILLNVDKTLGVGPRFDSSSWEQSRRHKRGPVIGLVLGPGLYNSVAHFGFLKALKEHKIRPSILTGYGLAGLIAVFYSLNESLPNAQWEFFKFIQATKGAELIHSKKWQQNAKTYLKRRFKKRTLTSLNHVIFLPIFSQARKNPKYAFRGPLEKLILEVLYFNHSWNKIPLSNINPSKLMNDKGADIILYVNVMPSEVKFNKTLKKARPFMISLGNKLKNEWEGSEYFIDLSGDVKSIDDIENMEDIVRRSYKRSRKLVEEIKQLMGNWNNN